MLQYEILRRGIYINNLTKIIKETIKKCSICIMNKLNRFVKPANIQIISKKPLERVEIDITYFKKKIDLLELKEKYLLNFTDHFSMFAKCYIIKDKASSSVLEKIKDFIKNKESHKFFY